MIKFLAISLTAAMLAACGGPAARTEKKMEKAPEDAVLCGGYTQERPLDEADKELFRSATASLDGVSYTPESVATQVVAGTNFRFVCTAETVTRTPETYRAEVIIYRPLPGQGEARITKIRRL